MTVADRQVGQPIAIGAPAGCIAVAPDGDLWACSGNNALVQVDPTRDRVVRTVALDGLPSAVVVSGGSG